ncbi:nucleoside phosphatase family-domain-containing protein [Neohortaea acidophila]|uniref:Nucleoside phosphatase family-domain-containing protein n=1 Tax=Neohortaea acidophila TaxID=245834 RepID=A0A6A6Q922_9PEZI|nr:nucleoside phosphatase family-domain-containing protein [Neohortaea acidophila]KAF2488143.1 nucleoside phosphatase family-domain-containing protein [Neohortaea acidophila]
MADETDSKHSYGVVIDAGSSGSRVYVYEYKRAAYVQAANDVKELGRLPKVKSKDDWHKKIHPGISTFGPRPDAVGEEHLKELVRFAEEIVPAGEVEATPIFLLATAGMRLLPDEQSAAVLKNVCSWLKGNSRFALPDCALHIQVIPGETEGLYGWIAANYLLGGFDKPEDHAHGKGHHTYGFLDMGGASAQIAFAPNATEAEKHANDLTLLRLRKVNGEPQEYGVFVTTWLGFGANEARRRYVEKLLAASTYNEVHDPCLPLGLRINPTGEILEESNPGAKTLLGTGNFEACLDATYPLLEKTAPCLDEPCLLNGVHTPAIDFDVNHFVGVSEYWHTTHEIFAMAHKDKAYDLYNYQRSVGQLCMREWDSIEEDLAKEKWGHKVDEKTVEEVCFKASWLINMLHNGIGVPRAGLEVTAAEDKPVPSKNRGFLDPFQAVEEIDGTDVSWTLGKMVLYASSQMPPLDGALPVGFGSNVPGGMPSDFQRPSGQIPGTQNPSGPASSSSPSTINATTTEDTTALQDWRDRISNPTFARRLPGILIVLLIIALAIYLLWSRRRRNARPSWQDAASKPNPSKRRKPGGLLSSKLFSRSGEQSYERVLEDGGPDDAYAPDVELSHVVDDARPSSSSSSLSPVTTKMGGGGGYFDSSTNGLGIYSPPSRGGLISRTESRERMAASPVLSAVPGGGIARSRSPLVGVVGAGLKASVD